MMKRNNGVGRRSPMAGRLFRPRDVGGLINLMLLVGIGTFCLNQILLLRVSIPEKEGLPLMGRDSIGKYLDSGRSGWVPCQLDNATTIRLPPFPTFIIIGAQKGGTSAMYELLKKVPGLTGSESFEPHFFDLNISSDLNERDPDTYTEHEICQLRKRYFDLHFSRNGKYPSDLGISFEKTPSYMAFPKIAKMIFAVVSPKPKLLVSLRDPVDRVFSSYKLFWLNNENSPAETRLKVLPSFEVVLDQSIAELRRLNGTLMPPVMTDRSASDWETANLPEIDNRPAPDFHTDNYMGVLMRGMYARQLKPFLDLWTLGVDIKIITIEALKKLPSETLSDILDFVGAPRDHNFTSLELSENLSPYREAAKEHSKGTPVMKEATRAYLKRFYKPYNDELADLLGEEYRGIWD